MRSLSASELLSIWERGAGGTPVDQALAILSIVFPRAQPDLLARLDIVQRDLCLLELRARTFGSQIEGIADCPACNQRLEFDFDARQLPAPDSLLPDPGTMQPSTPETYLVPNGYEVTCRLPNSADLARVVRSVDQASGRQQLLEACILAVQQDGEARTASDLPAEAVDLLVEQMSQNHPVSNLLLQVTCPDCATTWELIFDIVSYFWDEIHAWSRRLVHEVHTLAMAYGWREADILGMSAWRRQQYLEMIGV